MEITGERIGLHRGGAKDAEKTRRVKAGGSGGGSPYPEVGGTRKTLPGGRVSDQSVTHGGRGIAGEVSERAEGSPRFLGVLRVSAVE